MVRVGCGGGEGGVNGGGEGGMSGGGEGWVWRL